MITSKFPKHAKQWKKSVQFSSNRFSSRNEHFSSINKITVSSRESQLANYTREMNDVSQLMRHAKRQLREAHPMAEKHNQTGPMRLWTYKIDDKTMDLVDVRD